MQQSRNYVVRDSVTHSQYTVQLKVKLKISTLFFIPNCELWYIVEEWKRCSSLFRNPVGRLSICMPQCQRLICGQSTRRGQPFTIQQTIFPVSSRVIARTLVVLCLQWKKRFMPPKSGAVGFDLWEHNMFEERLDRCHLSAPVKRLKRRKFSSFPQVRRLPPSSSSYFPGALKSWMLVVWWVGAFQLPRVIIYWIWPHRRVCIDRIGGAEINYY